MPAEIVEEQKRLFTVDAEREGRPADRIPMIVEGRLNKWFESAGAVLLEQPYRDTDQKVADLITEKVARARREHPGRALRPHGGGGVGAGRAPTGGEAAERA